MILLFFCIYLFFIFCILAFKSRMALPKPISQSQISHFQHMDWKWTTFSVHIESCMELLSQIQNSLDEYYVGVIIAWGQHFLFTIFGGQWGDYFFIYSFFFQQATSLISDFLLSPFFTWLIVVNPSTMASPSILYRIWASGASLKRFKKHPENCRM